MASGPVRVCDICFQADDHPRHGTILNKPQGRPTQEQLAKVPTDLPITALDELLSPWITEHHMHCGADSGCGTCKAQVELAKNAQGDALRKHIQKNFAEHAAAIEKATS